MDLAAIVPEITNISTLRLSYNEFIDIIKQDWPCSTDFNKPSILDLFNKYGENIYIDNKKLTRRVLYKILNIGKWTSRKGNHILIGFISNDNYNTLSTTLEVVIKSVINNADSTTN
jgi:hypothetical protein